MTQRDHVFESDDDGFWYCMVGGREFGGWRFRDEAVGGMQVEQRRLRERQAKGERSNEGTVPPAPYSPDRFRMAFVAQMATANEAEAVLQWGTIHEQLYSGKWETEAEKMELVNGHAVLRAIMIYRFGLDPMASKSARSMRKVRR